MWTNKFLQNGVDWHLGVPRLSRRGYDGTTAKD